MELNPAPPTAPAAPAPAHPGRIFHWRGYLGIVVFVPLVGAAVLSGRSFPEGSLGGALANILGFVFLMAGLIVRTWATLYLAGRKSRLLVTGGPFQLCRNPLYLGSFLIGLSLAFLLESVTLLAGFVILGPLIYLPVVRVEERALEQNHGEAFRAYVRAVPRRFLPKWSGMRVSEPTVEVSLKGMRIHLIRSLPALAIYPATELIGIARDAGVIPVWFHLP